jgi:hypothetical protein
MVSKVLNDGTRGELVSTHVIRGSYPSFLNIKCMWLGLYGWRFSALSNFPTGPSFGIG